MFFKHNVTRLDSISAIHTVSEALRRIDSRLVDHGERVAFIAGELCEAGELPLDMKTLFLLSIFHDIGAYKTDEIDRMVEFETRDVWDHSIYGYLFLKYMTPLKEVAEGVLFHHCPWSTLKDLSSNHKCYAALIHLADRIDIVSVRGMNHLQFEQLWNSSTNLFSEEYMALTRKHFRHRRILERLADGSYRQSNQHRIRQFQISSDDALEYLKMVVCSIDFHSEYTVTHTINTVSFALNIARHFGLSEYEQENIYLGSLLHDVGKIAIPVEILESPTRLTAEEMAIMRTHVVETEHMIRGIVPDEICEIAIRHHEKLDGSGYPCGLLKEDLTFSQRIVAVSDIVSALSGERSYKNPFPKEKIILILQQMMRVQLDPRICDYVCSHYDNIMDDTLSSRTAVISRYQLLIAEFSQLKKQFGNRVTI